MNEWMNEIIINKWFGSAYCDFFYITEINLTSDYS